MSTFGRSVYILYLNQQCDTNIATSSGQHQPPTPPYPAITQQRMTANKTQEARPWTIQQPFGNEPGKVDENESIRKGPLR